MAFMNEALQVQVSVFRVPSCPCCAGTRLRYRPPGGYRVWIVLDFEAALQDMQEMMLVWGAEGQVLIIALASFTLPSWLGAPMAPLVEQFLVCS